MNKDQLESNLEDLHEIWKKDYIDACWESEGDCIEAFTEKFNPAFMKMINVARATKKKSDRLIVADALIEKMKEYFESCAELNTRQPDINDLLEDRRGL